MSKPANKQPTVRDSILAGLFMVPLVLILLIRRGQFRLSQGLVGLSRAVSQPAIFMACFWYLSIEVPGC